MNDNTLYINTKGIISFFTLRSSSYENLRRVYGAKYIADTCCWIFPAMPPFFEWVLEDLETILGDTLTLDVGVTTYVSRMSNLESKAVRGDLRGFTSKYAPYQHQKMGLARLLYHPRCAIFWDPGMGKTKLICDLILYLRGIQPKLKTLILGLRVNLTTWVNEMELHSEGKEKIVSLAAPTPKKREKLLQEAIDTNAAGVVCTYESARVSVDLLARYKYTMIVADECHKMQTYKSKLTLAALELANRASYRYILSGTPTKGRPTDIWAGLRFLGNFMVPKYWDFDKKYVARAHYNRHIITGYKNLDQLNELISNVADIKTSEECLDLPERTFQEIYCTPGHTQKKVYNSIVADTEGTVTVAKETLAVANLLTKLGKLSQVCSGFVYKSLKDPTLCDKCPHLKDCVRDEIQPYTSRCHVKTKDPGNKVIRLKGTNTVLENCVELCASHIENGKKVIVWAKHREMLNSLYQELSKDIGLDSVLRYDSTTTNPGEAEKQFNTDPAKKVMVAQITMGIGVTFKAPIMIYTELSFGLSDWLQSLDRNWGIRAKGLGPILVQVLLIKNSIYEQTYKLLKHKIDVASIIKDTPNCTLCVNILDCLTKDISPYDPKCILDKSAPTLTIKIKEI